MGALLEFYRSQRRRPDVAARVFSQPGDPAFSLGVTPSSQAQFHAAAAESRQFDNQGRSQNILLDAQRVGVDTSQPKYDPIQSAAKDGFLPRALTLGESLIGWLDGPRQAVNLMVQDLVGGEADASTGSGD